MLELIDKDTKFVIHSDYRHYGKINVKKFS